jgi:hypothetical protein
MKVVITPPSPSATQSLVTAIGNNPTHLIDIYKSGNDWVEVTLNGDVEAALGLLSGLIMAQPWYIGGPIPLSESLKLTAKTLAGRSRYIDGKVNEALGIDPATNTTYDNARKWRQPVDPLAFDLDGDGIETVGINGYNTVLFDHNGDGVKTGTGWVKSDDALLVLDRNGNGMIDNGGELFGADTVMSNGQKAANGLAALADLDSNHDGVFDASDAQYANARLWRDLNQNGTSEAGELMSLAEAGIASINLTGSATNTNLGNGNTQTAGTTYTRTDGTTGKAGNLDFAANDFYREFTDTIPLTDAAKTLPGMAGAGKVRDLREAASLDNQIVNDKGWRVAA